MIPGSGPLTNPPNGRSVPGETVSGSPDEARGSRHHSYDSCPSHEQTPTLASLLALLQHRLGMPSKMPAKILGVLRQDLPPHIAVVAASVEGPR